MNSKAKNEANKRWRQRNKKKNRYDSYRATCRLFIRIAKVKDLEDIQKRLNIREQKLKRLDIY